jgi:hypothetical protein
MWLQSVVERFLCEMIAETCVGLYIKCRVVVVVVIHNIGPKLIKIDSLVPEFPRADRHSKANRNVFTPHHSKSNIKIK